MFVGNLTSTRPIYHKVTFTPFGTIVLLVHVFVVEPAGLEPATFRLQSERSPN